MHLLILFLLSLLIRFIDTGAHAARLAGVRTGRPTLAASVYNVLTLGSRGAEVLYGPLLSSLTDLAVSERNTAALLTTYRGMMLGATAGTVLAALFIPTLSRILARGVLSFEQRGSLPRVVIRGVTVQGLWRMREDWMAPRVDTLRDTRRSPFPKRFLIAGVFTVAIATVSNFAALYASALVPEGARTALSLSPLIAGGGYLLTIFVVTPIAALLTDQVLQGDRPLKDATYLTIWQVSMACLGTLVAQLLLSPLGQLLAWITRWLLQ